ncbi:F-box/WD40 repeat-containing protein [Parachlamydia sp. AcF125]|uniref:F-box/WD repeat-containing protein n=1 Tax=Parachlamydia sp. AcF125 TaxID=2795736 RepID=UPI001BC8D60A|nr:F-box/WD40 repeat-containing protein [Parachlamydia sp. AcF125]MBS4168456.1 hypothetical protein [Parachlamydia sp. AcF125]
MNLLPTSTLSPAPILHIDEEVHFSTPKLLDEIWLRIFFYLPIKDLATSQLTCRRWKKLAADNLLWKPFLYHYFPFLFSIPAIRETDCKSQLSAQLSVQVNMKVNQAKIVDLTSQVLEKGHRGEIYAQFSPTGEQIIIQDSDGQLISLWDAQTGNCLYTYQAKKEIYPIEVSFSPNGCQIAVAGPRHFSLLDAKTGKCLVVLKERRIAYFSPNSRLLITTNGQNVCLRDPQTGLFIKTLEKNMPYGGSIFFSPNSQRIIVKRPESISLWNALTREKLKVLEEGGWGLKVSFSPDSKWFITYGNLPYACLWDAQTGKRIHSLGDDIGLGTHLLFSPDSKRIVTATNTRIQLWNIQTGVCLKKLEKGSWPARITFSPNSKWLAVAITSNEIAGNHDTQVWDTETGKCLHHFEEDVFSATRLVSFSSNSERIVTIRSNCVCLWDVVTGNCLRKLEIEGWYFNASFSPDGKRLAVLEELEEYVLQLWDAQTGECLKSERLENPFMIEFSPCSQWIVVSIEQETQLWDAKTGQCLYVVDTHTESQRVSFSPNGRKLLVGMKVFDFYRAEKGNFQTEEIIEDEFTEEPIDTSKKRKSDYIEGQQASGNDSAKEAEKVQSLPKQKKKKEA